MTIKSALRAIPPAARAITEIRWRQRVSRDAVLRACLASCVRGAFVVDVGASEGLYSLAMRRAVGRGGKVLALEPNPESFAALRRRTWGAGLDARCLAASSKGGLVDLMVPFGTDSGRDAGLGSLAPQTGGRYRTFQIEAVRLDDLLLEEQRPVRFVKIDVEGWEEQVVAGASGILARDRPDLLIEIERRHLLTSGADPRSIVERLLDMNYQCKAIAGDGTSVAWRDFDFATHQRLEEVDGATASSNYVSNFHFTQSGSR